MVNEITAGETVSGEFYFYLGYQITRLNGGDEYGRPYFFTDNFKLLTLAPNCPVSTVKNHPPLYSDIELSAGFLSPGPAPAPFISPVAKKTGLLKKIKSVFRGTND